MLSAYLFDQRHGESVTGWADAVKHLAGSQVLWLDLLDISDAEELEVQDALGLEDLEICAGGHEIAALTQRKDYLEVTAVCVAEAKDGITGATSRDPLLRRRELGADLPRRRTGADRRVYRGPG